jgi:hypothetical protein
VRSKIAGKYRIKCKAEPLPLKDGDSKFKLDVERVEGRDGFEDDLGCRMGNSFPERRKEKQS